MEQKGEAPVALLKKENHRMRVFPSLPASSRLSASLQLRAHSPKPRAVIMGAVYAADISAIAHYRPVLSLKHRRGAWSVEAGGAAEGEMAHALVWLVTGSDC